MNFSMANMLGEIERIVSFGIRRPGYVENLRTEQHLLGRFNELGLSDTRLEPVPVNYWQPVMSRLEVGDAAMNIPCFAVPYTGWTADDGLQARTVYVGNGPDEAFDSAHVTGRIVVADMQFGELNAAHLKAGSMFIHDPGDTIPDGPLHCANWLIPNFRATLLALSWRLLVFERTGVYMKRDFFCSRFCLDSMDFSPQPHDWIQL